MAKTPLLTVGITSLVMNHLKANLNNALKESDFQRADGLSLGQVDSKCFYNSEAYETLKCPACYVLPGDFKFNYDTEPNYIQGEMDLRVIMPAEAIEGSELQNKVESYSRVLFSVLDQQSLFDSANRIQVKLVSDSIEWGDVILQNETADKKKFRKDCIYTFKVISVENRLIP